MSFTRAGALSLIAAEIVDTRRIILTSFFVLLTGFGIWTGGQFIEACTELRHQEQQEQANQAKIAAAKARLDEQDRILHLLKNDPVFVEKAIRERLKYALPGEVIFRFDVGK
jgi:cell division protein FtsB